jgi:hypothetical protein
MEKAFIFNILNRLKRLLIEWIFVLIFIVVILNSLGFIYLILNSPESLGNILGFNYFLFIYLFVYLFSSLVSFHIGYFILLIGVREVIYKKFKRGRFLKLIFFLFPYIVMNLYFLELVNKVFILKVTGFILLLVGLYLYFKVGLEEKKNLSTE